MEWLNGILAEHSVIQAVIVVSLVSAIGLVLGKITLWGVSLGVTFVFFAGIMAGHWGLTIDPQMLNYAESFGLILFVYALGLQVGPGFFASLGKSGIRLNLLAMRCDLSFGSCRCNYSLEYDSETVCLPYIF